LSPFGLLYYGFQLVRSGARDRRVVYALPLVFLGGLSFFQALSRYDYIHVLPSTLFCLAVVFAIAYRIRPSDPTHPGASATLSVLVIIAGLYFFPALQTYLQILRVFPPQSCFTLIADASCAYVQPDSLEALRYLRSNTEETEQIYVGNQVHDYIFVNDVSFYFLSGRRSATRYHELHPGVANTREVQQEIIEELRSKQVGWLVLVDIWISTEPNLSSVSTGVYDLDEFIQENYRLATEYGMYQVWQRRGN
jgi:hypothetical protein